MRAGKQRRKLKIQKRSEVSDGGGGKEYGWTTVAEGIMARDVSEQGSEKVVGDLLSGVITHRLSIRLSSRTRDLTNRNRLVDMRTGDIHDVKSVIPHEKGRWLQVMTQTGGRVD